jgi:adenylate cyclase
MATKGYKRKLTAILSADVVGYSRLMRDDEEATVRDIASHRLRVTEIIEQNQGRVIDSPGDNILAEFVSVVDAVKGAIKIQEVLKNQNADTPSVRRMEFRIGINLGDVIDEGGSIYGEGVNIAARIEGLASAGGIAISGTVYEHIKNKLPLGFQYFGEKKVKNISEPIRVYGLLASPGDTGKLVGDKRLKSKKWNWMLYGVISLIVIGGCIFLTWNIYFRSSLEPFLMKNLGLALPEKPSIAVLPFTNMSGDPEQEYFSDGLTEDLITDLSKFSGLFVISRNSVFIYKGKTVKPDTVRDELGVQYMLEGSVRKSGDRLRITAQLIDTTTGGHHWAERYDRKLTDLFTLQDEITQQIVSALGVKFSQIEQGRAFRKKTANLNAFDYNLRGWWFYHRYTQENNRQARKMFERAIELEPEFARAYAGLGLTYYEQYAQLWSQDPNTLERAFELAKKAITLDDSESAAHTLLSHVYLWRKQLDQAIAEQERAIALNPNNAYGYADLAEALIWAGKPADALELIKKAMRLNPHYPPNYLYILGSAYLRMERYDEAVAALKTTLIRKPDHLGGHLLLAVIYSGAGREDDANAHVAEALKVNPQLSIEGLKQRLPALPENAVTALRKAGLPD